jgi:N-ethylmaleimide reductase
MLKFKMTGHIKAFTVWIFIMQQSNLFTPLRAGAYELAHRIVMAPLTRMRAQQPGNIPGALNAIYYGQRATLGGLIIAESAQISQEGQAYPGTPGIHSPTQVAGWRLVTDAVHSKGGLIFLQLVHAGRMSHSSLQPDRQLPVAPSAIAPASNVTTMTATGEFVPLETPRVLSTEEMPRLVADFHQAATDALAAGFDGVEIHGANGFLLDQYLQNRTNQRRDEYGGSSENRSRLLFEVVDAVVTVWGHERVGVRLSPYGTFNDIGDSDPIALFTDVITGLSARQLAYLHLIEPRSGTPGMSDLGDDMAPAIAKLFRNTFQGTIIAAGGFTKETGEEAIDNGTADAIAFGRLFISNPDLPRRFQLNAVLNSYDRATFYGGNEQGYVDYPLFE